MLRVGLVIHKGEANQSLMVQGPFVQSLVIWVHVGVCLTRRIVVTTSTTRFCILARARERGRERERKKSKERKIER